MVLIYFKLLVNDPETPVSRPVLNSIIFQAPIYITRLQAKNVPSFTAVPTDTSNGNTNQPSPFTHQ